ncbi:hypothetical protein SUGI_0191910 [Cryptomeria japonica]|uniref:lysine-specific demethylase JMJ32 isoform X3 n=1 Tax=Cryptomeria japonica TaxID=3369 RepID=UPI002408B128|nr:lysine-specific demethylase JMJ32 isoform X3 [Cryptomeria japonica]GLJ12483.1 hypothetical protein SUGI_0191910 [Cryptomeria japonica]
MAEAINSGLHQKYNRGNENVIPREEGEGFALGKLWEEVRDLSLGAGSQVERVHGPLSPLHFLRDYVMPNKPCIITDSLHHWPALSKWSNHYLSSLLQHQTVSLHFTPDGRADSLEKNPDQHNNNEWPSCFVSAYVERMPFPEALQYIAGSKLGERGVAYAQEQNGCFFSEYSLLAGDVEEDIPWATEALGTKPDAVNLWIGNERATTSFHKDHYENLYAVVSGQKHFLLMPPTDVHRMYVRDHPAAHYTISQATGEFSIELDNPPQYVPWASIDPYPPSSEVEQSRILFPRYFNGPKPFECTVQAGEILYLPSLWFHHVRQTPDAEGRTIAINYWYDMQFDIKYAYFNFLQSLSFPSL